MTNTEGGAPLPAPIRIPRYFWALAGFWTAAIALVLAWRLFDVREEAVASARYEAAGAWKKEAAVIRWAADSGAVYVPVTKQTRPDPDLAFLPERDATTPSGRKLTVISPPQIMHQVHAVAKGQSGYQGHITSLNPIRPEDAPDPWERRALEAFSRGISEENTVERIGGQPYLRLTRPLRIEQSCLRCHAEQGYKLGDVRGGLTVSVPMEPALAVQRTETRDRTLGYGLIWALGLFGIAFMSRHLKRQVRRRADAETKLREAHDLLEQRVVERTAELADANQSLQSEIGERRQAEQWLLESEQRFRGYFEQGLVGMAILTAGRQWEEVNQRLCRMLGYTEEELLLKTWRELTHPDDRAAEDPQFQRLLDGGQSGFVLDKRFLRKDGTVLQAGLSAQCMRKADGTIDCLLILVQEMPGPPPP